MAITPKRTKLILVGCAAFAATGLFLAPPQWPAIGIAALCGAIYAFLVSASQEEQPTARIFAQLLVFFGWIFAEHKFSVKHDGLVAFGAVFQYIGVAYFIGVALGWAYLVRSKEKNTG